MHEPLTLGLWPIGTDTDGSGVWTDGTDTWNSGEPLTPAESAEATMRHAPEPAPACDWPMPCDTKGCPDHGHDYCRDHDPRCGRPAVAVYVLADHAYPRCKRHDTVAAQRRAATDGWARRPVAQEDPA